jgi:short-subunit dehydrogenase
VKRVLLVGATSAIAAEVARVHAARGDRLYLLARDPAKLETLVRSLGDAVVGHEAGDLNELAANAGRVERAFDALGRVDVVLVAHGLLGDQVRAEHELDHALEIVTTNFTSAVSLLIPLVNRLEAQGDGHLGVITSVAGERGRPRNYTYGASKGGLTRYLQGVRSRLHGTGVHVLNVKLGPVDTPMTADHAKHALFGEKSAVARSLVRALEGRRHVVYLTPVWGPIMAVVRLLPEPIFQRFGFLAGR